MRIIDLHCYPGTPTWIESQGPYPAELARYCREAGLAVGDIIGMTYNPFSKTYALGADTDVNYLMSSRRDY